jgi:hypothetical protein
MPRTPLKEKNASFQRELRQLKERVKRDGVGSRNHRNISDGTTQTTLEGVKC